VKIWDITPPLVPGMPTWPGDTPFTVERTWQLSQDCPVNVSKLVLSSHTGAHADAPLHYDAEGLDSAAMPLEPYLGRCRLVDVCAAGSTVEIAHLVTALIDAPPRLLLRTRAAPAATTWDPAFVAIGAHAIDAMAAAGVTLVGVDTPSLDPEQSKTLDAHQRVKAHGMAILEGLDLHGVPEGDYELIALPLAIAGVDASPVRAILRALA
jgi:arylformamidase